MAANFDFKRRLGQGYFGEVWLATDMALNVERAVKLIPPDKVLDPNNFFHEAQLLKAVEHPNVVRVEETGMMSDGRIYVAMELLKNGSVEDEASGSHLDLRRAKKLMIDVLRGLEHAHQRNVLHRDVKPANILVGNAKEGKLSDFGLAIEGGTNLRAMGVKEYNYMLHMAPELFDKKAHSVATDVYACGATLYRMVNGDTLFTPPPQAQLQKKVQRGLFPDRALHRDFIPLALRRVISKALEVRPSQRFQSACEMRRALEAVTLELGWSERKLAKGTQWTGESSNWRYEVTCARGSNGKWAVETRKGRPGAPMRRVGAMSKIDMSKASADAWARRLLQDFVLGKVD